MTRWRDVLLLKRVPLTAAALALALAGLGNLLAPYAPVARLACGVVSAVFVLLVLVRIAVDLPTVRAELSQPPALAVFPTLTMALMLLATYVVPVAPTAAFALWIAALLAQAALTASFVARHVVRFKLAAVAPGWFVTFVGFVVGSVTAPAFGMEAVGRVLLVAGFAGYGIALALVILRLVRLGELPAPLRPTVAIFLAPPSLLLAGYLAVVSDKQPTAVYVLLGAMTVSLAYVATQLMPVLRMSFLPSHAALTFPFVIAATALARSSAYVGMAGESVPGWVVMLCVAVATAVVAYVLVRMSLLIVTGSVTGAAPAAAAQATPATETP